MASHKPPGWPDVIPRLFTKDVAGLTNFMRRVLGAQGKTLQGSPAEMRIGDSVIMVSDDSVRNSQTGCLYVYLNDCDATFQLALAAGAEIIEAPADTPYGDRRCIVKDAWGNTWQIATYGPPP